MICACGLLTFGGLILFLIWWSNTRVLNGDGWQRSAPSLSAIGQALLFYHKKHGQLPPAVITDRQGKPLYSWRVALLVYLEEAELYDEFKRDEPWDSPHNKKLLTRTPRCYLPSLSQREVPAGMTHYQVFVGPGTAFERPGLTLDEFPQRGAKLMLVAEAAEPVPWTKPVDLVYDPDEPFPGLGRKYTKAVHFLGFPVGRTPGFVACFGDGFARFISNKNDEKTLRGMISPDR
jgi:hypothetical protein